jgi:uncharacterized protein (DUF924 family)
VWQAILDFWFEETPPERRWKADADFDRLIAERFTDIYEQALRSGLSAWRLAPRGRLAEIIVLDQFSRNLYRNDRRAFAQDAFALDLAQQATRADSDLECSPDECVFLYMPYMHSESRSIHVVAERLYAKIGRPDSYDYELRHKAIIDRFGRYPHRNAILGRPSSEDEEAFLDQPGSSF